MKATQDDILAVEEAQQQILEAVETLKQVQRHTQNEWARSYIISHLETVATSEHEWLSRDQNIDDWLSQLRNEVEDVPTDCPRCGDPLNKEGCCENCYWESGMCLELECDRIIGELADSCPVHGDQSDLVS